MSADTRPGRTFGRVAEAYDRTRPEHSITAVEHAAHELGLTPAAAVLDLAAGTGKLTRVLRRCFHAVIAVEPDDAMRSYIGGDARAGSAESIPLADGSVDAVYVAEAFHWFDAQAALAEIERVLRAGGGLVVIDRTWGDEADALLPPELTADIDAIWARFHAPGVVFPSWLDTVEPGGHARFDERVRISGRDLVDLCLTASTPASIPDDERRAVAEHAYPLMEAEYTLSVPTDVYWKRVR